MAPGELEYHPGPRVHWYIIATVLMGALGFLVGVSICAYKWYQHRLHENVNSRVSLAIHKGLKTNLHGKMRKSPSVKSNVSMKRTPSATLSPEVDDTFNVRDSVENKDLIDSPMGRKNSPSCPPVEALHFKACSVLEENGRTTPEKDDASKEKGEDELKLNKLGQLQFGVEYDKHKTALVVTVVRASDLPAKDANIGSSDPYVKLQLLPEKRHKVKTRVLRKTLNPIFDEIFTFYGIDFNQLHGVTLHFVILSFDRFSRDDIIGEVLYPLSAVDWEENVTFTEMKPISPRHIKIHSQGRGELLVSLCHQPAANRLTVVILKARNLPKMDITGLSDPYVKVYLLYNGQRIAKKKTHVKKRTLNPVFNESFLFDVPCNEGLQNISLEFLVLDWDRMTKNEIVGRLDIGSKFGGQEVHHWNEVMNCPRKQIAEWHKLKE